MKIRFFRVISLIFCVKRLASLSLVTYNFTTINSVVTKLGSQMHMGNLHAMVPSGVTC